MDHLAIDIYLIYIIHIRNLILSIWIRMRSDIKYLDSDTDYPYSVLTLSGWTDMGKYPSRFYSYTFYQLFSYARVVLNFF